MESLLSEMRLDDSDFEDAGQKCKKPRLEILERRRLRKEEKKKKKKNKLRRKKKNRSSDPAMKQAMKRVNHFVAIQVTDSTIKEQVKFIQEKMLASPCTILKKNKVKKKSILEGEVDNGAPEIQNGAIFQEAMERLQSLHFTLNVIGLYNEEDINKAKAAVETCWGKHKSAIMENPIHLDVEGLGHFGHKVIYAKIQSEEHVERLNSLSDDLRAEFRKLNIFQDSCPFKAHMTIAKLSKSKMFFQKKIRFFPQEIWTDFQTHSFGQQPVESLQLLSMSRDPITKYYKILSEVSLHPPSPPPSPIDQIQS